MSWPIPQPGLVIRYSYLWDREARTGREEGVKDRPCAIVLVVRPDGDDAPKVYVLPITHSVPLDLAMAVEIPTVTKNRLSLDSERSWVMIDESNEFAWPGPDLRPAVNGDPSSVAFGMLPPRFFNELKRKFLLAHRVRRARIVSRTE